MMTWTLTKQGQNKLAAAQTKRERNMPNARQIKWSWAGHINRLKGKKGSYSAVSSPLDRSKRFTLFASPGRPVHSDTNSASPGSILAMLQLRAKTKSLTFPPLSIARYSFIQLSQQGRQWSVNEKPNLRNGSKGGFEPWLT